MRTEVIEETVIVIRPLRRRRKRLPWWQQVLILSPLAVGLPVTFGLILLTRP